MPTDPSTRNLSTQPRPCNEMVRKIVVLKASTVFENSHSSYGLDCLLASLVSEATSLDIDLDIRVHCLALHFPQPPLSRQPNSVPSEVALIANDFFHNDLLLIGAQNHNFSPSLPLMAFFQWLRPRLLEFDSQDRLIRRNLDDMKIGIVLTGRSSRLRYYLLNRFVFFVHFDMLFDFWRSRHNGNFVQLLLRPGHKIEKHYIENCLRSTFVDRKEEIETRMRCFAKRLIRLIN